MEKTKLKVVLFPWSAFGHMIPFHELAVTLGKQGVTVSYVSTPRNIERLPQIPPELSSVVQYVSFSFPAVPNSNMPQGAEATVDMEFDDIPYLKIAYDGLREPLQQFASTFGADWIISDFAAHWMPEVAKECQARLMFFSVYTAATLCFLGPPEYLSGEGREAVRKTPESLTKPPHWGAGVFPESVAYRQYEVNPIHNGMYGHNASGITDGARLSTLLKGCDSVGIRSCRDFEGEYIDLYQRLIHMPVVPVGVLPPRPSASISQGTPTTGPWSETFNWLDHQKPGSVIYVGFGSEYKLTKQEVYEIAYGLEIAQLPFVWALRRPTWAGDESEALPPEFVHRTLGKGIVRLGWAPQLKILSHPSIGGSLFHSGWGSIIETLHYRHSLVLLPFVIDQGLNARLMVEKGVGVEVERSQDGSYTRDDVAAALKTAMLGDGAQKIKAKATNVAKTFSDQELQQGRYIREFVQHLEKLN